MKRHVSSTDTMKRIPVRLKWYWLFATLFAMGLLWGAYPYDHSLLPALSGIGFASFLLYAIIWLLRRILRPRPKRNVP